MGTRWRRLTAELAKFVTVGGVATLVACVIFNYLVHGFPVGLHAPMSRHPISAYVVANTVGMLISYRGSRSWVFAERRTAHPDGGRTAYFAINAVTMTLPVGCLWVSRHLFGFEDPISDNLSANVIGLSMGMVARFYLFRTLVFNIHHQPEPALSARPE
jgi:putative flippase GtrA